MVQASLGVGLAMVIGSVSGAETDSWVSEDLCMAATKKLGNEYRGSLMEQMQSEYVSAYVKKGLADAEPLKPRAGGSAAASASAGGEASDPGET